MTAKRIIEIVVATSLLGLTSTALAGTEDDAGSQTECVSMGQPGLERCTAEKWHNRTTDAKEGTLHIEENFGAWWYELYGEQVLWSGTIDNYLEWMEYLDGSTQTMYHFQVVVQQIPIGDDCTQYTTTYEAILNKKTGELDQKSQTIEEPCPE